MAGECAEFDSQSRQKNILYIELYYMLDRMFMLNETHKVIKAEGVIVIESWQQVELVSSMCLVCCRVNGSRFFSNNSSWDGEPLIPGIVYNEQQQYGSE